MAGLSDAQATSESRGLAFRVGDCRIFGVEFRGLDFGFGFRVFRIVGFRAQGLGCSATQGGSEHEFW